jgi:hypothetical protein
MIYWVLLMVSNVWAHPFSQEEYSLRTAIKVSEKGVVPLVALEVPIPIALSEIGAESSDPKDVKKRKIKQYNQKQWDTLAENLKFTINGTEVLGEWLAIEHPANGKAAEGFFVYLVSFNPKKPYDALSNGTEIVIENKAYQHVPMVYTGSAYASEPYAIKSSTSNDILGEHAEKELTDAQRWTKDETLRTMKVVVVK